MCRLRTRLLAALALTLTLAGCATAEDASDEGVAVEHDTMGAMDDDGRDMDHADGHAGEERTHDPVDGAPVLVIDAVDIDFEPETLSLTAGEPANVTVVNHGEILHDFTLDIADVHVNLEPGEEQTTSLTVDEPGTYEARCTVAGHAEAGMTIDIVVT